jgi:hypothetical protein
VNEHSIPPVRLLDEGAHAQMQQAEAQYRRGLTDAFVGSDEAHAWWDMGDLAEGELR